MRLIRFFLLVILCSVAAFGQQTPVGIQTADLDRSANPCNDFYEFSNGAWRPAYPIPATMDRWSRRWAAGESNKDQLGVTLEEASAKPFASAFSCKPEAAMVRPAAARCVVW